MALKKIRRTPSRSGAAAPPRSRAFFLELLINMFIFMLCAVVALLVFLEAKTVTDEAATLTQLSLDAKTIAEEFKVQGADALDAALFAEREPEAAEASSNENGTLTYYYNHELEFAAADEAAHSLVVAPVSGSNDLVSVVQISAYTSEEELFTYTVSFYEPEERG